MLITLKINKLKTDYNYKREVFLIFNKRSVSLA